MERRSPTLLFVKLVTYVFLELLELALELCIASAGLEDEVLKPLA